MLRPANQSESSSLTDLALRAKAHWGYDAAFIEDCRAELTITSGYIRNNIVKVYERDGRAVAFYSLEPRDGEVELVHLFVEPEMIGSGIGKLLWHDAVKIAREQGFQSMVIISDPFAEGFYLAMGAEPVGAINSSVRPGRELPLLRLQL